MVRPRQVFLLLYLPMHKELQSVHLLAHTLVLFWYLLFPVQSHIYQDLLQLQDGASSGNIFLILYHQLWWNGFQTSLQMYKKIQHSFPDLFCCWNGSSILFLKSAHFLKYWTIQCKVHYDLHNGKYKKRTYIRKKRSVRSGEHRRKNTRQKSNTSTLPELLQQQIVRSDRWLFRNPPDQMSQMQKRGGDTAGTLQWTAIQKADLLLQNT